jgi:hypothetical protein
MIKVVSLFKRKKGISHEAFQDYYENKHVRIFRELHGLAGYERYVRRYLRPIKRSATAVSHSAEFDVVMEGWYSPQFYERFFENPRPFSSEFLETVVKDEENLFDRSQMFVHRVEEYESDLPPSLVPSRKALNDPTVKKVVILGRKKQGMGFEEFKDYYEKKHVKLIEKYFQIPGVGRYTRRYLTPLTDIISGNTPSSGTDVITEIWFSDKTIFENYVTHGALQDPDAANIIAADESRFLDRDETVVNTVVECDTVLSQSSLKRELFGT